MPWSLSYISTPPSLARKSKCQKARRYSPSVTACRPLAFWSAMAWMMAASSVARSPAAPSVPAACAARASRKGTGRSRLPTMSARKGGLPWGIGCPLSTGQAEVALRHLRPGDDLGAGGDERDTAALQHHGAAGNGQHQMRVLLDD